MKKITIEFEEDRQDDCIDYDFWAKDEDGGFLMLASAKSGSNGRLPAWEAKIKAKWGQDVEIKTYLNMP